MTSTLLHAYKNCTKFSPITEIKKPGLTANFGGGDSILLVYSLIERLLLTLMI